MDTVGCDVHRSSRRRREAMRRGGALLLAFVVISYHASHAQFAESSVGASKGMRHPVPLHIMKWTDKLKVQDWLDAVQAELTENGTKPLDTGCDNQFGLGYLNNWKAAKQDICLPGGESTFTCYDHPPHNHGATIGSLFCTASNLILDSEDFLGAVRSGRPREPGTGGADFPNPKKGSARVGCTLADPLPWARARVADNHADKWLYDALLAAPPADVASACSDPRRTVSYPVYFVTRMDPTNAFHHFEEVVNFFSALALYPEKQLLQQGITIVALDGLKPGFYLELWRRVAYPYRVRFLRSRPYPPGTCFKHVLLASMPHRSLYTHFWPGRSTNCRSLVFSAVMRWAHALTADTRPESYIWPDGQHRQNEETVVGRVMWVSRRHFETANKHKFTGWQHQRAVGDDDGVVTALAAAVREWNSASCLRSPEQGGCRRLPVYFEFGSIELGDHRWYPDQLSLLARTNVLVAVHGAGVFNEVWLRPASSSVLEVTHNSAGNYHYHNIAAFLGLPYHSYDSAHNVQGLAAKLREIMDETAVRMAADAARQREVVAAAAAATEKGESGGGEGGKGGVV